MSAAILRLHHALGGLGRLIMAVLGMKLVTDVIVLLGQ